MILNGIGFDGDGRVKAQPSPYPGSNLFSLASGGAIYIRDPFRQIDEEHLNGGEIVALKTISVLTSNPVLTIGVDDLYAEFCKWCKAKGIRRFIFASSCT